MLVVVVGVAPGNRNGSLGWGWVALSIECIPLVVFKFERFFEISRVVFFFGQLSTLLEILAACDMVLRPKNDT